MTANHNLRGALLGLTAMALYATHDAVVKFLGGHLLPTQIVFFSALFSLPAIALLLWRERDQGPLWPQNPLWVGIRTLSAVTSLVFAFYAFGTLPLAQTYAILFSIPLFITLLSIPILGARVRLRRWTAVIVGLVGVLIVLRPGQAPLALGHLAALVAAVTGALAVLGVRKLGQSERPLVLLAYPILANVALMGLTLPFTWRPMSGTDALSLAAVAALGLMGALLSIHAYRAADPVLVAPMQYSQILWAILYGTLFFGEHPDRTTLLGAAIVIASGLYILMREARAG